MAGYRRRRGVVLIVVTIVIMLISLAAYGFLTLMETENKASRARGDQMQAQSVACSGREYLASLLERPRSERPAGAASDDLPEQFGNIVVDGSQDQRDEDERQGRFSVIAPNDSETAAQHWRFGYENESAKINLGRLLARERREPGAAREALLNLPNMDESTADAILDWIDPDDSVRDLGAESEYYQGLQPPRRPRNGLPPSLEELLLVKGVTREKLFGVDLNANFAVDSSEEKLADEQAEIATSSHVPWSQFLTVRSAERDETYEGEQRIRLNQSDLGKLQRELTSAFQPTWANFIVAYRQYGPYRRSGEEADVATLTVDPSIPARRFIRSPLELIGARVGIPQPDKKVKVYASPLTDDPAAMSQYLTQLMDAVTVGSGTPIFGRINVNLAPREVLMALPGIDSSLADRIVSSRSLRSTDDTSHRHAVWLLAEGIVDRPTMMRLERYVTVGGDVGRAQIIGYYDQRSPIARFETVVDATDRPARQVYYKDLRRLGRGVLKDVMNVTSTP